MTDKYDETAERIWDKLGPKHGVVSPESYIRDIAEALRAAVAEEREACGRLIAEATIEAARRGMAEEREACAKTLEEFDERAHSNQRHDWNRLGRVAIREGIKRIRERS